MIDLAELAGLVDAHRGALAAPVAPIRLGGVLRDLDREPLVMGVVNLSRDSTYRDSVAVSTESAVRRGRVMAAQGAGLVDVGAESTTLRASRLDAGGQAARLVPVVSGLAEAGVAVSVEAYSARVVAACLAAGAAVVNLTGTSQADAILDLAAAHGAAVVLCRLPGTDARDVGEFGNAGDPIPALLDHFGPRLEQARSRGVVDLIVDPGLGFFYSDLTDPMTRARRQASVLLQSFRLRPLGVPVCQALPHAFDIFEDQFRSAEGFFAVLSLLARVNVLRTHETAQVAAVVRAMSALG